MIEQFEKAGVGFEFFDAVDADTLDFEKTGYVPHMNLICTKRRSELDPSEVACFASHRRLWQRCIEQDLGHIAIFEDDIVLTKDFRNTLRSLAERIGEHDAIKLDWIPHKVRLSGIGDVYPGRELGSLTSWIPSSAAYILSNTGARKLLIGSQRYCDVVDGFLFSLRRGWDVKQLVEPIAAQAMFLPKAIRGRYPPEIVNGQRDSWFDKPLDAALSKAVKPHKTLTFRINYECGKALHKFGWAWHDIRNRRRRHLGPLPFDFEALQ